MIDISELVDDPDFAQTFQVIRVTGGFAGEGVYTQVDAVPASFVGVIQPTSSADTVQFLQEGERLGNMITVWCKQEIKAADAQGQNSDIVIWHGSKHRVLKARHWQDFGYWQAWAEGFNA